MSDGNKSGLADPDLWIRLVYMILFAVLTWVARLVILVIALIQFVVTLFSGQANSNLKNLGDGIAQWSCQAFRFLTFASEQKPYPFQDWPETSVDEGSATTVPSSEAGSPLENQPQQPDSGDDHQPEAR